MTQIERLPAGKQGFSYFKICVYPFNPCYPCSCHSLAV